MVQTGAAGISKVVPAETLVWQMAINFLVVLHCCQRAGSPVVDLIMVKKSTTKVALFFAG